MPHREEGSLPSTCCCECNTLANTAHYAVGRLCCNGTQLTYIQPVHQDLQVLFCCCLKSSLSVTSLNYVWLTNFSQTVLLQLQPLTDVTLSWLPAGLSVTDQNPLIPMVQPTHLNVHLPRPYVTNLTIKILWKTVHVLWKLLSRDWFHNLRSILTIMIYSPYRDG